MRTRGASSGRKAKMRRRNSSAVDAIASHGQPGHYVSHTRSRSKWLRFVQLYLAQVAYLRQMNTTGERRGFGPPISTGKLPIWSRLVQVFYFYFTLKLVASLVLQHQYNMLTRDLLFSGEDQAEASGSPGNSASGAGTREPAAPEVNQTASKSEREHQEKRAQLELTVARLQLIGNAYYEFGAPMEPLFLLFAYISYLTYMQAQIYVALVKGVTVDLLCAFTDPQRHRWLILAPEIERQTARYIGSSENHLMARLASGACLSDEPQVSGHPGALSFGRLGGEHFNWRQGPWHALADAHEREVRQVAELVASGDLVPPNRHFDWIERLARVYGGLVLLIGLSSLGAISALLIVLPRMHLTTLQLHNGPLDLLFQAEFFCFCVLLSQCYTYDLAGAIVVAFDQAKFVNTLRRMIVKCTVPPKPGQTRDSRSLIRVVIFYEMLKDQLRGIQACLGFVSASFLAVMLLMPVLARLYAAQMAREYRYLYLACSLLVILNCDLAILPYCWLHSRCLDMLHSRSRLLSSIDAHLFASHQRTVSNQASVSPLWRDNHYEEHTVCLFRRDQQAPEMAVRTFAVDAYFIRLTYASLLGLHFWCGLLLAPMCLRDTAHSLGSSDNLLALIL